MNSCSECQTLARDDLDTVREERAAQVQPFTDEADVRGSLGLEASPPQASKEKVWI